METEKREIYLPEKSRDESFFEIGEDRTHIPSFPGLSYEGLSEEERNLVKRLLEKYELMQIESGFNRLKVARNLLENPKAPYTDVADMLEESYPSVRKNANRMIEAGLISEERELTPEGNIVVSNLNTYIENYIEDLDIPITGYPKERLREEIDQEIAGILSCVSKSKPNGRRDSKIVGLLAFGTDPEYPTRYIADVTGVESFYNSHFNEWVDKGLAKKKNGTYSPTDKLYRFENTIRNTYEEIWTLDQFLEDIVEVKNSVGNFNLSSYSRKGKFDSMWYKQFGFDTWKDAVEYAEEKTQP